MLDVNGALSKMSFPCPGDVEIRSMKEMFDEQELQLAEDSHTQTEHDFLLVHLLLAFCLDDAFHEVAHIASRASPSCQQVPHVVSIVESAAYFRDGYVQKGFESLPNDIEDLNISQLRRYCQAYHQKRVARNISRCFAYIRIDDARKLLATTASECVEFFTGLGWVVEGDMLSLSNSQNSCSVGAFPQPEIMPLSDTLGLLTSLEALSSPPHRPAIGEW
eukprot:GHVN01002017.1.p1 GENE.GHVN01002017.1~~GHVN01002017.1.p1  ORF type:complete len:219 (-),score=19.74 GHVN01002017.1:1138-1794(-)